VVSRDNLIAAVWNGRIVSEATLSSRLNAVRCAIGDSGAEQRLVRTLRRKGVRFVGVVHERPGPDESGAAKGANERGALVSPDRPSIGVLPFKSFRAFPD
jgi:adenylate cyclase